jgi:iron-sulfur cluster assembly protein
MNQMTDITGPQEASTPLSGAMKQAVTLTPAAVERIRTLFADNATQQPQALWVGVKTKGCSGLSYDMRFLTQAEIDGFAALKRFERPEQVTQDGVTIFVDSKAAMYLTGTVMDWVSDGMSAKFAFINPNEKGRCGCGESFHV